MLTYLPLKPFSLVPCLDQRGIGGDAAFTSASAGPRAIYRASKGYHGKGYDARDRENPSPSPAPSILRAYHLVGRPRHVVDTTQRPTLENKPTLIFGSSPLEFSPRLAQRGRTAGHPLALRRHPSADYITIYDIYRLINPIRFAAFVGTPVNQFLTVTWKDHPEFRLLNLRDLNKILLQRLSAWLLRAGITPTYAYFRENTVGRGPHTHVLLRLPVAQAEHLRRELFEFLHASFRFKVRRSVHIKAAPGPIGLVKYAAKAINPAEALETGSGVVALAEFLGVRTERQAAVNIQRVGCTRNLDQKQRVEACFTDIADVLALQRALARRPEEQGVQAARPGKASARAPAA